MSKTSMDTHNDNRNIHRIATEKRLLRDLNTLQKAPPIGVSGAPDGDDIMTWTAVIVGPSETEWEGGGFKLSLKFSESYPYKPPSVRFVCNMFHPNIAADGYICLDILEDQWNSCYDVAAILISIQSMLCDPNADNPVNVEAGHMFKYKKREYKQRVLKLVEQSWTDDKKTYEDVSSLCSRFRKQISLTEYLQKF